MTLASLLFAATVIGGEVGPFVSWPDAVIADEKHTPGSFEFYDEVDEMVVYDSGIVYRNGTVVTNVPFPQVVASMDDDCDYGWCYDVSQSIGQGEHFQVGYKRRRRIRMNQFDLTWYSLTNLSQSVEAQVIYFAYGTGCVRKAISPSVMLPVSRRLDNDTRSALLASYEAYFERLYWGSKGDVNDWDEKWFGRKTPGPGFWFNNTVNYDVFCTNHFEHVYPTNDVRLLEYPNFVNLANAVKRMFPTYEGDNSYSDLRHDHPAWLYRPGWMQRSCLAMWWSSSKLPRLEDQPIDEDHTYRPEVTDFTLLPVTGWTNLNSLAVEDAKWACRSFTLDVFDRGNGFGRQTDSRLFPCYLLLDLVSPSDSAPTNLPIWQTDDTICDYLTNVYDYAGIESVNKTNAFSKYLSSLNNDSHRLKPSAFAGVNQLLAAMDRTITIPKDSYVVYRHGTFRVKRSSYYADSREPSGRWDDDGHWHVSYGNGLHTLQAVGYTNSLEYAESYLASTCELKINPLKDKEARIDPKDVIELPDADIEVRYDFFAYLCEMTGWEELVITSLNRTANDMLEVWCVKVEDNRMVPETGEVVVVPVGKFHFDGDLLPHVLECHASRSYEYFASTNQVADEVVFPVQPPVDAGDRVREAKYALAWCRWWRGSGYAYDTEWKLDPERDYTRNGWVNMMVRHGAEAKKDLDELALDFYGVDYRKPGEFAPMPQTVSVTVSGELEYAPASYEIKSLMEYPRPYYYTKERYRLDFSVPEYGIDVTNLTATVSNIAVRAETAAFVKEEVAPDGWRWVTEAYTNVVSETQVGASGSTDEEIVTAITYGATNQVTKYRWAGDVYPNVERLEWTNHLSQARLTTVVESDHYGFQTNVVIYYDDHLVVTNAETNVTALAYLTATTNVESQTEWGPTEFKEWTDNYPYPYPYGEIRDDYTFLVNEYIYDLNGMATWVCFDPMTGEMVVTMHGGVSYPLVIGTGYEELERVSGDEPFELSVDWPEMPEDRFEGEELFHSINRVDWNWKSMHDKGN